MMNSKKGFSPAIVGIVSGIAAVVILFVVMGLIIAQGSNIIEDQQADLTLNSAAYNATVNAQDAVTNISEKQGMLANVIIGAAVITVLLVAFGGFLYMRNK